MGDVVRRPLDSRIRRLVHDCRGRRVIHVGCADVPFTEEKLREGSLLHEHLLGCSSDCMGVDSSEHGLRLLRARWPQAAFCSPSDESVLREFNPDVIVAGEVIEHIRDFGSFFQMLSKASGPQTELIITTPNAYALKGTMRALAGQEVQHPDHVCLFSPKTISRLLEDHGFRVIACEFYNNPPRSLGAAIPGVLINGILRLTPRASDGLYVRAAIR